jgi:undecaprenyl-diphosphatase
MNSLDLSIVSFLNQFAHRSVRFDKFVVLLNITSLLKGGVIVGIIWWIWFGTEDIRRKREALLATVIASCPAVIIAKIFNALTYRARPFNEPRLHFQLPYGIEATTWASYSSFPSEHAVLFFALAMGIFYAKRKAGWFAFTYVATIICLPRVYLGEHYPTDILVGALLGCLPVWVANRPGTRQPLTGWVLRWMEARPWQFYPFCFIVSYLIVELFNPLIKMALFFSKGKL